MQATALSMYTASVPCLARSLRNLAAILDKAQQHAQSHGIDPAVLASSRLYPDMYPLAAQVRIACESAMSAVARLAGLQVPAMEGGETTLLELKGRFLGDVT
jgi:hypothetical protein